MTSANRRYSLGILPVVLIGALASVGLLTPTTAKANTDPNTPWILYDGQSGENVWCVQFILKNFANQRDLKVDSIFGPQTRESVIRLQIITGLQADGIVGPNTGEMLKFIIESKAPGSFGICQDLLPTLS